jgi:hypothetical protein
MTGMALLVGTLAHLKGSAHPAPSAFVIASTSAAIALLLIGTISYGVASRALVGYWTLWAVIPGVNVFYFTWLSTVQLGGRPGTRLLSTAIFVVIFCSQFRTEPWLAIALVFMIFDQYRWAHATRDQLSASPK